MFGTDSFRRTLWRHVMRHDALGYATERLIRSLGEYAMATAGSPNILLVQELTKRLLTVLVQFSEERLGDVEARRVKEILVTAPLWCAALIVATGVRSAEGDAIQVLARRIDYEGRTEEEWDAIMARAVRLLERWVAGMGDEKA